MVIFMGAEPTVNPHLPRLIAAARGSGFASQYLDQRTAPQQLGVLVEAARGGVGHD